MEPPKEITMLCHKAGKQIMVETETIKHKMFGLIQLFQKEIHDAIGILSTGFSNHYNKHLINIHSLSKVINDHIYHRIVLSDNDIKELYTKYNEITTKTLIDKLNKYINNYSDPYIRQYKLSSIAKILFANPYVLPFHPSHNE